MMKPLVSVVLAVFNGEKYIGEALESVLQQDYRPFEVIIVDDGSTDRTAEVVRSHVRAGDVRYHFQHNQGIGAARNTGIRLALGDIIGFIDADDLWVQGKLTAQVQIMEADPTVEVVQGRIRQFLSPDLAEEEREDLRLMRDELLSPLPSSCLFRRSAFVKTGLFNASIRFADMDWVARAQDVPLKVAAHDEVIHLRRVHRTNIGRQNPAHVERLHALKATLDRRRGRT